VDTINRPTRAAYGCLVAGQSLMAAGLARTAYRLRQLSTSVNVNINLYSALSHSASSVCDITAPLQLQLPLVALYKSVMSFKALYLLWWERFDLRCRHCERSSAAHIRHAAFMTAAASAPWRMALQGRHVLT